MASLSSLPVELVLHIYSYLDPGMHLDFSLVSKSMAYHSRDILQRHQDCHMQYRIGCFSTVHSKKRAPQPSLRRTAPQSNARDDHTIWTPLDEVATDSVAAWHVRELKIPSPDVAWHVSDLGQDEDTNIDYLLKDRLWSAIESSSHIANYGRSRDTEIDMPLDHKLWLNTQSGSPSTAEPYEADLRKARQDLMNASLVFKQLVLVAAIFPRLHVLRLTRDSKPEHEGSTEGNPVEFSGPTLLRLSTTFRNASFWPPGLYSLRRVSVRGPRDGNSSLHTVLASFLLPSISTIHLIDMQFSLVEDVQDCEVLHHNTRIRSSVQNIILDGITGRYMDLVLRQLMSLGRDLTSIVFNDCSMIPNLSTILKDLGGHKLETMILCSNYSSVRRGYLGFSWDCLEALTAVRILSVNVLNMVPTSTRRSHIEVRYSGETRQAFLDRFVQSIPQTVEVLILQDSAERLNDEEMQKINDALVQLVKQRRCPNLAAVYVDNFEVGMRALRCLWGRHTDGNWLQEARSYIRGEDIAMYAQDEVGATNKFIESVMNDFE